MADERFTATLHASHVSAAGGGRCRWFSKKVVVIGGGVLFLLFGSAAALAVHKISKDAEFRRELELERRIADERFEMERRLDDQRFELERRLEDQRAELEQRIEDERDELEQQIEDGRRPARKGKVLSPSHKAPAPPPVITLPTKSNSHSAVYNSPIFRGPGVEVNLPRYSDDRGDLHGVVRNNTGMTLRQLSLSVQTAEWKRRYDFDFRTPNTYSDSFLIYVWHERLEVEEITVLNVAVSR